MKAEDIILILRSNEDKNGRISYNEASELLLTLHKLHIDKYKSEKREEIIKELEREKKQYVKFTRFGELTGVEVSISIVKEAMK
jgi:hypothetical protein